MPQRTNAAVGLAVHDLVEADGAVEALGERRGVGEGAAVALGALGLACSTVGGAHLARVTLSGVQLRLEGSGAALSASDGVAEHGGVGADAAGLAGGLLRGRLEVPGDTIHARSLIRQTLRLARFAADTGGCARVGLV